MHSGFLEEYPLIRVDNFTATLPRLPPELPPSARHDLPRGATNFSSPHISFLSHPHTDHLAGLSSLTRQSAPIYCSNVTKQLLLALERKADRERFDAGEGSRKRPYQSLRKSQKECQILTRERGAGHIAGWDLLHGLPFNEPMMLNYTAQMSIRVTLLPANHMPGSAMILIEGSRGTILHTGDMRAEEHFIEHLLTKTHLGRLPLQHFKMPISPEIVQGEAQGDSLEKLQDFHPIPRLMNIYLDTERLLDSGIPLSKSAAIYDVLQLLRILPKKLRVHIGCWTSGYEEFLLSLAATFPSEQSGFIHVDRYKMGLMQIMSMDSIFVDLPKVCSTDKGQCQRFCACEDSDCIEASDIRVEASEGMDELRWGIVKQDLIKAIAEARAGNDEWPRRIPLPLQRHSPLPEIFSMIKRLKPVKVTANTASYSARFVLGKISEQLSLSGHENEMERQRILMGCKGTSDASQWIECCQIWDNMAGVETTEESEAAFYAQIGQFRRRLRTLSKLQSHRLELERMDADEGPSVLVAEIDLAQPTSSVTGPWSAQGRYAAAGASPFLTPAMRRANAATTSSTLVANNSTTRDTDSTKASGPILSIELASRYLAYASMFLGWKIRNPSRYHPPLAWKAIRKMNPILARQSEEALLKELGLAIPPWDDDSTEKNTTSDGSISTIEMIPVPKTPPLRATFSTNGKSSSPNRVRIAEKESISPLQLAGTALLRRLDEEAASQDLIDRIESEQSQCAGLDEVDAQMADIENIPIATLTTLERQLRGDLTTSYEDKEGVEAEGLYSQIVSEWQQAEVISLDKRRFTLQLNIVGAAIRSRRGRRMLCWNNVDFQKAYHALRRIYSGQRSSLPVRGQAVLSSLRKSFYNK